MDCIFCNIINKNVAATIEFADSGVVVVRDIRPQAPVHLLILPRKHIATINNVQSKDDERLLGHMVVVAKMMADDQQLSTDGYRLVFNVNANGGQDVYHIH